jgi:hypothetical protein
MTRKRIFSAVMAAVLGFGVLSLLAPLPAEAQRRRARVRANSRENAWRIGTYAGTAATAAALAKGRGTWALIGAGATLLSYSQWRQEVRRRHRREGSYQDYLRYRQNWQRTNARRNTARNSRARRR